MFRSKNDNPKQEEHVNVLIMGGGIGDMLAAIPAIKYLVDTHPWLIFHIWVSDFIVDFVKAIIPESFNCIIRDHSQAKKKYNDKLTGVSTLWDARTAMRVHPSFFAYLNMADKMPSLEEASYPKLDVSKIDIKKFSLPEKYAIIPVASTSKVKELSPELITQISKYLLVKGITPVYVGRSSFLEDKGRVKLEVKTEISEADYSLGIDLTNKTTLLEVAAIMANAKAVIGMDGGLIHVAGFTETSIVCAYTFVNPNNIMPIRNGKIGHNVYPVVPDENLGCRFCQSNMTLMFDHDFRVCYYGLNDFTCVKQITFEKFKEQMDKIL